MIPKIIEHGKLVADDVGNQYGNGQNKTFAYITYNAKIDGKAVALKLDIKKSPQKNKFWVHRIELIEIANDFPTSTNNAEVGQTTVGNIDSISQTTENVKTSPENSKKFSIRDINNDRYILREAFSDKTLWNFC